MPAAIYIPPYIDKIIIFFFYKYKKNQRDESDHLKLAIFGPFGHFSHPVWPKNLPNPKILNRTFVR